MSVRLHVCGCMSDWARVCIAGLWYSMPVSHIRFIIPPKFIDIHNLEKLYYLVLFNFVRRVHLLHVCFQITNGTVLSHSAFVIPNACSHQLQTCVTIWREPVV